MGEKIYVYNKLTNTLHIKDFCSNSNPVEKELYETENDVIKAKGKYVKMCEICERKKESVLQDYVRKQK